MKRRWNAAIWAGFLIVLAAPVLDLAVFVRYPVTRDVPWATALVFLSGLVLVGAGLRRARREPQVYRGRIAGTILGVLGALLFGFFLFANLFLARRLPASQGAPAVGEMAPDFTLPDKDGTAVTLSRLLRPEPGRAEKPAGAILIFYRGYW